MHSIFVATSSVPSFSQDKAHRSPERAVDLLVFEGQDDSLEFSPVAQRKKHLPCRAACFSCPHSQPCEHSLLLHKKETESLVPMQFQQKSMK